ncbi:hypothetical protein L1987_60712 [Smallanthus sonchifolius]|uniref:Uncharacterized protein n=1 Tax=Smallanthus sonchifolius TaxID=185202 RepID=A0ACB9D915_9ASTR|nr:hypothetical protein L1987_60712 [Smallanthus sonchifolius]
MLRALRPSMAATSGVQIVGRGVEKEEGKEKEKNGHICLVKPGAEIEKTINAFAEGEYGVDIQTKVSITVKSEEAKVRPSATECKKKRLFAEGADPTVSGKQECGT